MSTSWTSEQQQVIDLRNRDILVSAAAGSGKTAVLVERIIKKVTDPTHPVDIDHMLVVTFTSAAAAEMRERIRSAIEQAVEANPEDAHLLRQLTLVHNAQITTIHSFCMYVIRNHFHEISLDPDFRMGDEGEMKLLRAKVLDKVLEDNYSSQNEDFLALVSDYSRGGKDAEIVDMVEQLYTFAISYPWPKEWLQQAVKTYEVSSIEELKKSRWMKRTIEEVLLQIKEAMEHTQELISIAERQDGPGCYLKSLKTDIDLYKAFLSETDYEILQELFITLKYPMIGNSRGYTGDPELLEQVKNERDELKKMVTKLGKDYFSQTVEEIMEKLQAIRPYALELTRLTDEYMDAFTATKREKNLLDFNDLEHFALHILVDKETGMSRPAAEEFIDHFDEIMIDEYQDSNYIQETILKSISKESKGGHNLFMVGDVKQSIYRFRLARPEIFMEKYDRFTTADGAQQRIDLHMNFRSRHEVLDSANDVFYKIMHKDLGNVEYDDVAALNTGAQNYEAVENMYATEILVGNQDDLVYPVHEIEDKVTYEAKMVAVRIEQMMQNQYVTDKESGQLRKVRYSDIVILMRSPGSMGDSFVEVLHKNEIPAHMTSQTGYFDTMEVETVLSLLQVLDNPYQDIPLTAVLHSAMFRIDNTTLAEIRTTYPREGFAKACFLYCKEHPENAALQNFVTFLNKMRGMVNDTPIHQMIEMALEETHFLEYVTALPQGETRKANLEKLIDQAISYESSSYKGLFHFVNYIAKLQKYEVDFGSAELVNENDDAVRIMSIHKSKGLEFPVVFVCGMGKQFNQQDSRGKMILHPEYGIGLEYIDGIRRVKSNTFYKKVIEHAVAMETLGEELRVLYVAMTRAKEKLILTGMMKKANEAVSNARELSYTQRTGAKCYFDWIIPALNAYPSKYKIQVVSLEELVTHLANEVLRREWKKRCFTMLEANADRSIMEQIDDNLQYQYPYEEEGDYKSKYSVSEIKHKAIEQVYRDEEAEPIFVSHHKEDYVPAFMSDMVQENQGALRGTAVHRFLECFDFTRLTVKENGQERKRVGEELHREIEQQLQQMLACGKLTEQQKELLLMSKIEHFLDGNTACRMGTAAGDEKLYVEKAFVIGDRPEVFFDDAKTTSDEMILIQGIIDVFFEEEDGIVLLDYKTDKVDSSEELVKRYQKQLQLYGEAITRTMGKKVKEILIYSFALEETIRIE